MVRMPGAYSSRPRFQVSPRCRAFNAITRGSRVTDKAAFGEALARYLMAGSVPVGPTPDRITLTAGVEAGVASSADIRPEIVLSGWGDRTANPADYVLWPDKGTGRVELCLKREKGLLTSTVEIRAVSRIGYLALPDTDAAEERRTATADVVILDVLAYGVEKAMPEPVAYLRRLADPSAKWADWPLSRIREDALSVVMFHSTYCEVADAPPKEDKP